MAYLLIEDFKAGMDVRKSVFTAPPGSLRRIVNAHLTRGGEIEKRKAMKAYANLPAGQTFGLHSARGNLYVFGTALPVDVTVPAGFTYQRLVTVTPGLTISRILSATTFRGKPYVLAEFVTGERHQFYDGVQVTDWDAQYGTLGSMENVAAAFAALITSSTIVSAAAVGLVVTVTARETNTAFTFSTEAINGTGGVDDQSIVGATTTPASVGVAQVTTFTLSGTYEDADTFTIKIADIPYVLSGQDAAQPTCVKTFQDKVYSTAGSVLGFSGFRGVNLTPDPTAWSPSYDGAAAINLSMKDEGAEELLATGVYQKQLAVFSRRSVQIWTVDPDPDKNFLAQTLNWVGARAPNAITSLGEIDLFFLSDTGIRSLRARNVTDLASTQDVGTAIDPDVVSWMQSLPSEVVDAAVAVVDPLDGRVLVSVGGRTYVFSHFPGSGISAWSTYEFGFTPETYAVRGTQVFCRSGDRVYLYGGESGLEYDDCPVLARLPFHDAGTPATQKSMRGIDVGCVGTWEVSIGFSPDDPDEEELVARVVGSTYGNKERFTVAGQSTHFSLIFRHEADGPALLANAAIHYDAAESG